MTPCVQVSLQTWVFMATIVAYIAVVLTLILWKTWKR